MRVNPYLNRKMITNQAEFYGRKQIMSALFNHVSTSQSVSIIGERRIGKSSVLNMLCLPEMRIRYPQYNFEKMLFIYIDLLDKADSLPGQLFEYILQNIHQQMPTDGCPRLPARFDYNAIREFIEQLCRNQSYRLVICLDEFDVVTENHNFDMQFYSFLRSIANQYSFALVTASQHRLGELCHSEEIKGSPFFNIFTTKRLELMTDTEIRELITQPSSKYGILFSPEQIDFISKMTGCHPFFTQIACYYLFDKIQTDEILTHRDYRRIKKAVLDEIEGHLQYAFKYFTKAELSALIAISQKHDVDHLSENVLEDLESKGYLVYRDDGYHLFGEIIGEYINLYLSEHSKDQSSSKFEDQIEIPTANQDIVIWSDGEVRGKILNKYFKCSSSRKKIPIKNIQQMQIEEKGRGTRNLKLFEFKVTMKDGSIEVTNILESSIFIQTSTEKKKKIATVELQEIRFSSVN